jgi:hypothetical protein
MGPVAVIIAAVMALSKAFAWVSEVAGRYGKMLRTIQGDNEAAGIKRLTDSVKKLTTAYAEANAAADRQASISKGRTDALRAEERATLDLAKAKAIAALDPADKEGRERVEKQFDEQAAQAAGQQKAADLLAEQTREQEKAARAVALVATLKEKSEAAYGRIVRANADVLRSTQRMVGGVKVKSKFEEKKEDLTGAQKRATDAVDAFRQINEEIKKAQAQAETSTATAAAKWREAAAAKVEEQARAMTVETQAVIDNQDEITKLQKEAADKRVAIAEETARLIADAELSKQEDVLNAEKEKVEAKLKASEEIAKMTVAEFIDKQKGERDETKRTEDEAARRAKLAEKQARGVKLSKGDQEFLDAAKAIAAAKLESEIQAGEKMKLENDLKRLRDKDSANLDKMQASLAVIENKLVPLLLSKG